MKKISIKLPGTLLPNDIAKSVKEKAHMNRVIMNKSYSYEYLLSGILFCKCCGNCLTGLKNGKYRYYRHHNSDKKKPNCVNNIRARDIENAVLYEISLFINSTTNLESALRNAHYDSTVNINKLRKLEFT